MLKEVYTYQCSGLLNPKKFKKMLPKASKSMKEFMIADYKVKFKLVKKEEFVKKSNNKQNNRNNNKE